MTFNRFFYALFYFTKPFIGFASWILFDRIKWFLFPSIGINLVNSWNINQAYTCSLSLGYKEELKMQYGGLEGIFVICFHSRRRAYLSNWQYINDNIPWKCPFLKTSWISIKTLIKKNNKKKLGDFWYICALYPMIFKKGWKVNHTIMPIPTSCWINQMSFTLN